MASFASNQKVASLGLEPRITESKSVVLPLHYEAFCLRRDYAKPILAALAIAKIIQYARRRSRISSTKCPAIDVMI